MGLQAYKNLRRRRDGSSAAVTGRTKHAAISVIMLGLGGSRLGILGGRRLRTDRRQIEGIGYGVGDHAKCRDRRKQLHYDREQHDWNELFQSPSHDFPQDALVWYHSRRCVSRLLAAYGDALICQKQKPQN